MESSVPHSWIIKTAKLSKGSWLPVSISASTALILNLADISGSFIYTLVIRKILPACSKTSGYTYIKVFDFTACRYSPAFLPDIPAHF